jgi:restriction endonuclease S subunit
MKLNIKAWSLIEIGSVSKEVNDKLTSLVGYESEKFIRPEDLLIGDLFVKSHRSPVGIGSGKKCELGDILFARRSVSISQFKRRSCILTFDGICSDELTVIRENQEKITKGFLNLILNTQVLWDYAISRSGGSVSKRIKWQDLKKYQFKLPPKDEQEKILSLLLTLEKQIEQTEEQEKNQRRLAKKIIDDFIDNNRFGTLLNDENLTEYTWKDCVDKLLRRTDAVADGIERIVAGENLESEDFKIRTWGTVGKDFLGPAFHVMFEPGDILYGSRRTYLRKVSLSDFRGVCANTTFVVRAKEDLLLQELLKHIMLSERFTQYSIAKSKGSTNPYINWKDLDDFTFKLPDLGSQKKMVEILDGCIDLAEKARTQTATLKKLKHQLLDEILG